MHQRVLEMHTDYVLLSNVVLGEVDKMETYLIIYSTCSPTLKNKKLKLIKNIEIKPVRKGTFRCTL